MVVAFDMSVHALIPLSVEHVNRVRRTSQDHETTILKSLKDSLISLLPWSDTSNKTQPNIRRWRESAEWTITRTSVWIVWSQRCWKNVVIAQKNHRGDRGSARLRTRNTSSKYGLPQHCWLILLIQVYEKKIYLVIKSIKLLVITQKMIRIVQRIMEHCEKYSQNWLTCDEQTS